LCVHRLRCPTTNLGYGITETRRVTARTYEPFLLCAHVRSLFKDSVFETKEKVKLFSLVSRTRIPRGHLWLWLGTLTMLEFFGMLNKFVRNCRWTGSTNLEHIEDLEARHIISKSSELLSHTQQFV